MTFPFLPCWAWLGMEGAPDSWEMGSGSNMSLWSGCVRVGRCRLSLQPGVRQDIITSGGSSDVLLSGKWPDGSRGPQVFT